MSVSNWYFCTRLRFMFRKVRTCHVIEYLYFNLLCSSIPFLTQYLTERRVKKLSIETRYVIYATLRLGSITKYIKSSQITTMVLFHSHSQFVSGTLLVIGFGRSLLHCCVHIRHPVKFTICACIAPCTTLFTIQWQLHVNL